MQFWVNAPVFGPGIDGKMLSEVAVAADELGYDALVVADHVLVAADSQPEGLRTVNESIVSLSYMAALTKNIRLGTSVLVAPLRNAVELSKQIASLDVLTAGRVFIGLGVGGIEPEFRNLGADFHARGKYVDETIDLMRHLFSGSTEPFEGQFNTLKNYSFLPLPVQGAELPILVGGMSQAALRRAAIRGDMWVSANLGPEEFRPLAARVKELAGDRRVTTGAETRYGTDWGARLRGQTGDEIRAEMGEWRDAGCDHLSVGFRKMDQMVEHMEWFAREVFPEYHTA